MSATTSEVSVLDTMRAGSSIIGMISGDIVDERLFFRT
jgi:hypothetical protein